MVLVSLFLMQRCGLLFFGYPHVAHPAFDETASGVLTCDLLDGQLKAPLFSYQYEARSGDGLIEGFLLVPLFKFLSRSLFSLKILALLSAFLSLLCWIIFMVRYRGIWTAIIFTSLFAFPPLMFARLNLMGTIASHHSINPLMALQLLLLFLITEGGNTKRMSWLWLAFGFLSGLGAYAFYTYIIFVGFCLLFFIIVRWKNVTLGRMLLFLGGLIAGLSPWIASLLLSPAGGRYLLSIVQNIRINLWSFIQNFGFNLPHSLGYSYPSHNIGMVSFLFSLCIVFFSGIIVKEFFHDWFSFKHTPLKKIFEELPPSTLQGMYVLIFPLFFLGCLSLSPMKIMPFEYWPRIGFFGYSSSADIYRYRWLHLLFPFYFATMSIGMSILLRSTRGVKLLKGIAIVALIFFVFWSMVKTVGFYSIRDIGELFYYKGYNYDQMANRFILGDMNRLNTEQAEQLALSYPEENRGEAYRCLGTKVVLELRHDALSGEKLERMLKTTSPFYLDDFVYGIVRSAQMLSPEEFRPFKKAVVKKYPPTFYTQWGFRHLGYKYYGLLLNWKNIVKNIPSFEKWVFKNFLKGYNLYINRREGMEKQLIDEIEEVPVQQRVDVIRGLGMLVGAEMLFDPMHAPDYPLDSKFGTILSGERLTEAFYEGIGGGFAETLSRFLRTLLLPEGLSSPLVEKMLDIEWERCHRLMSRLSPSHASLMERGFLMTLPKMHLDDGIRTYLCEKMLRD